MLPDGPSVGTLFGGWLWLAFSLAFLLVAFERASDAHWVEIAGWSLLGVAMAMTGLLELVAIADPWRGGLSTGSLVFVLVGVVALAWERRRRAAVGQGS